MFHKLVRKLGHVVRLSTADRLALTTLTQAFARRIRQRADIVREGERPRGLGMVLDGWASVYKTLEDGRRQTLAILLPGDLCDLHATTLHETDHSIAAITPLSYAEIPAAAIDTLVAERPRIGRALMWSTAVNAAIQREWTLNLGQRTAPERIAHLVCELYVRSRRVDLASATGFDCPLTQADVAEATGMTPVHVNRTLQDLRSRGLIAWRGGTIAIPDWSELASAALFCPRYLHLGEDAPPPDAAD